MPPEVEMTTRKVSLPMMTRTAHIEPKTLDEENRTVEVIFTKGARVLRRRFFDEDFIEELGLKKSEVRMGRLESGTSPVLDTHGFSARSGVNAVLGVVQSAKLIPGKEGRATLRFSKRADVEPVFQDIKDGILRNVSVGYNTFRVKEVGVDDNGLKIFRSVDWEPGEISMVPVGADPTAQVRSKEEKMTECVVEEIKTATSEPVDATRDAGDTENTGSPNQTVAKPENVSDTRKTNTGANPMPPENADKTPVDKKKIADEARAAAKKEEKARQFDIRSIVKKTGFDSALADEYIEADKSAAEVREAVIEKLAEKDGEDKNNTRGANVTGGEDLGRKGRVDGMTSALLHRFRPKNEDTVVDGRKVTMPGFELCEAGRSYAYLSLVDMARACLEGNDVRTGMLPKHVIADTALNNTRGLHSISDFPEILANVANKTLRSGYLAAPQTWKPFTNEVFVSDFKEISRTNLGDAPKLELLQEGSEVKRGSISEAAEKYRVEEFAKIIAVSRKVIVNDDLGAFTRIPERMGRRAADLESDELWNLIKANANLNDGFALFSAQHGNLSTVPAAPDEAGLSELRKLMRRQVGLDGAEISLTPIWIYVPPEHETVAEKLIASIVPDSSTNVSPFSSAGRTPLRLDVEPRLETGTDGSLTAWFGMADKGQVDMVELARLEGTDGPQIQTRDGFDVNGMEIKIMHDIGTKAIDFRGLFKNAGA